MRFFFLSISVIFHNKSLQCYFMWELLNDNMVTVFAYKQMKTGWIKVLHLRMCGHHYIHEQPLNPNQGCRGAGVYSSGHQARGSNAGPTLGAWRTCGHHIPKGSKVKLNPQNFWLWVQRVDPKTWDSTLSGEIVCDQSNSGLADSCWQFIMKRNINHDVLSQNKYKLWTQGNYIPHVTYLSIRTFKAVKHSLNRTKTCQWFFFSVIRGGRLDRFLAAHSNSHLVTCTRLISDASSCQTACSLLHNTNEQLSRTDEHMKKWPS